MDDKMAAEIEWLKEEYLQIERLGHDEKECLLKVINT